MLRFRQSFVTDFLVCTRSKRFRQKRNEEEFSERGNPLFCVLRLFVGSGCNGQGSGVSVGCGLRLPLCWLL